MRKFFTSILVLASFVAMTGAMAMDSAPLCEDNPMDAAISTSDEEEPEPNYYYEEDDFGEDLGYSILNGYVISDNVNIREEADINSPVVGKLRQYQSLGVNGLPDGTIQNENGWTQVLYITDDASIEGWVATKFLAMFDFKAPDCSVFDGEPRELLVPDNDPNFGMITLKCVGDKLEGEMWIKNSDMIESGGNGILMWIDLAGHLYYGSPVIEPVGEENNRYWGDMLRTVVAYDSKNDILLVGGMLWK